MKGKRDPVKKNMDKFCKPAVQKDRKQYTRKQKHKKDDLT